MISYDVEYIYKDIKNKGQYHPNILIWSRAFFFPLGKTVIIRSLSKLTLKKKSFRKQTIIERKALDLKKKGKKRKVLLGVFKSLSL